MAFFSRVLWIIVAFIVGPLYSNINPNYKPLFPIVGIVLGVLLVIWVSYFAWKKPEYLLYGAETHFEKWKTTFYGDKGQTPQMGDPVIT